MDQDSMYSAWPECIQYMKHEWHPMHDAELIIDLNLHLTYLDYIM